MTTKQQIRALLTEHPDGLTIPQLMEMLGKADKPLRFAVRAMEDVYIAEWMRPKAGPWCAVWKRASIPEDAPRPNGKPRPTREVELGRIRSREHQRRKAVAKKAAPAKAEKTPQIYVPQKTQWAFPPPWAN